MTRYPKFGIGAKVILSPLIHRAMGWEVTESNMYGEVVNFYDDDIYLLRLDDGSLVPNVHGKDIALFRELSGEIG